MARKLLTTVDEVISAIEYTLQTFGKISDPNALYGDESVLEHFKLGDFSVVDDDVPFMSDEEIDLQAALDSVDPTIWVESLKENPSLKRDVEKTLNDRLTEAGVPPKDFDGMKLDAKVHRLYNLQHPGSPPKAKEEPEFFIGIVTELLDNGSFEIAQRYITYDTKWFDFLEALEWATASFDVEERKTIQGHMIKDGPWFYKVYQSREMPGLSNLGDEGWEKLADELGYRDMKKMLYEKRDANVGAILRHEQTAIRQRAIKADWDDFIASHNRPDNQVLDENGDPYFDPDPLFESGQIAASLNRKMVLAAGDFARAARAERKAKGEMTEEDAQAEEEDNRWLEGRKRHWEEVKRKRAEEKLAKQQKSREIEDAKREDADRERAKQKAAKQQKAKEAKDAEQPESTRKTLERGNEPTSSD